MSEPSAGALLFRAPGEAPARRLLLVTPHFPPRQSAGSLRWERLADHMHEAGWGLDVVTTGAAADGSRMEGSGPSGRLPSLPPGTGVYSVPEVPSLPSRLEARAYAAWRRARRGSRGATTYPSVSDANAGPVQPSRPGFVPREDVRWRLSEPRGWLRLYWAVAERATQLAWAGRAARVGIRLASEGAYDAVVTSAPPHWIHTAGRRIARVTGAPHVADFRDPWSRSERLLEASATPLWLRLADRDEGRVVRDAAAILMNTELAADSMKERYPWCQQRIAVVPNGFDGPAAAAPTGSDGVFRIVHAGSLYLGRDPTGLLRAVAALAHGADVGPERVHLELIGETEPATAREVERLIAAESLDAVVTTLPRISREELAPRLARASVLSSISAQRTTIPSKVFEYMGHEAWLLVLAPEDSAPWRVLAQTEADLAAPADHEAIAAHLERRYREFETGVRPTRGRWPARLGRAAAADRLMVVLSEVAS